MSIRSQVNTTNQKILPIQTTSTFPSADNYLDACDRFDRYFAEVQEIWQQRDEALVARIAAHQANTAH
jgi:hypothetical protein